MKTTDSDALAFAREVMTVEAGAIARAAERLGLEFQAALDLLEACAGKVVTTGVGKSGLAARKLASTLTSVGCPAVFLHPSEAMHGDLGIVSGGDVVIALSNSGESEELSAILPALGARKAQLIAIVGNLESTLARRADVALDAAIEREACPLNLAPTTSVVVAMALGDALAMALQKRRGFGEADYALNHPGGRLGRRLTLKVRDVMRVEGARVPQVRPDTPLMDILCEISENGVGGATCVADATGALVGIITDYDVRHAFQRLGPASFDETARTIMNPNPAVVLSPDQLAYDALLQMKASPEHPYSVAPVVDAAGRCAGMLHVHDLVRAGL